MIVQTLDSIGDATHKKLWHGAFLDQKEQLFLFPLD